MACKVVIRGQDECVPLSAINVGEYFEYESHAWFKVSGGHETVPYCLVRRVGFTQDEQARETWPVYRLRLVHAEFERVVTE